MIHSPIEIERFQQVRDATAAQQFEWRNAFSARPDVPHVVSVGALDRRKRHHVVIDRLAPLLRAQEMTLTIAGDGPEEASLAGQAAALGVGDAVCFLGFVSDVPALLGAADLLVHASELEGVPQTVIQALAAGVPVVVTEMEGLWEVSDRVRCVDQQGLGLIEAVTEILKAPGQWPVAPADTYRAWSAAAVEDAHEALFSAAEKFLTRRREGGRSPGSGKPLAEIVDLGTVGQPAVAPRPAKARRPGLEIHGLASLVAQAGERKNRSERARARRAGGT